MSPLPRCGLCTRFIDSEKGTHHLVTTTRVETHWGARRDVPAGESERWPPHSRNEVQCRKAKSGMALQLAGIQGARWWESLFAAVVVSGGISIQPQEHVQKTSPPSPQPLEPARDQLIVLPARSQLANKSLKASINLCWIKLNKRRNVKGSCLPLN